ncbi:hypothetical protein QUF70_10005 [Desulfobacterales bacterium HSG17]|nr:hypothetical protein [Desulfobacterales bacterium HSG17]
MLKHSLHNEVIIELGRETKPDSVESFQNPFHIKVKTSHSNYRMLDPDETIIQLFDKSGQALLILGAPGSGKTVTLLDLARHLADRAEPDPAQPVPIVLNLSSWTNKKQLINWTDASFCNILKLLILNF